MFDDDDDVDFLKPNWGNQAATTTADEFDADDGDLDDVDDFFGSDGESDNEGDGHAETAADPLYQGALGLFGDDDEDDAAETAALAKKTAAKAALFDDDDDEDDDGLFG